MTRFADNGPTGKHGRHAAPEQSSKPSTFFQTEEDFPYNPYKKDATANDGPVPYTDRKAEVARLRSKKRHHGKAPKIIAAVVIVLVIVIGASGAAFASSAMEAKDDAQALVTQAQNMKDQFVAGDTASAKQTSQELEQTVNKLHDTTSGPLWSAATLIPVVGGDIQTVRTVSDSAQVLVNDVLTPAMDVMPENGLAGLMGSDGAINVKVLEDILNIISGSGPVLTEYAAKLDAAPEPTIEQLKEPIAQVKSLMSTLAPIADSATELKDTLPAILGADGKRTYLVLACTGAEIRSSVGFAGSFGLVTVDNGKIEMGEFSGRGISPRLNTPVSAATEEDRKLFRWEATVDSADATQITDFKRVGEVESQIWEANGNGKVDGVIALDTVVLQRMLGLTGATVNTPGGDFLDGSNASDFLLNGVYMKYDDPKEQDMVFALTADTAAKGIFGNIASVNMADLINVLTASASEGRFCAYMSDDEEEQVLKDFGFAGTLSEDTKEPELGIYASAGRAGKMYFYLTSEVQVGKGVKNPDGSTTYDVEVRYDDTLTSEKAASLTSYIVNGLKDYDGAMDVVVYLQAPAGGKISDVSTEGEFFGPDKYTLGDFAIRAGGEEPMNETTYQGNNFWYGWGYATPDSDVVVKFKVTTAPDAENDLMVHTTPLASETVIDYQ